MLVYLARFGLRIGEYGGAIERRRRAKSSRPNTGRSPSRPGARRPRPSADSRYPRKSAANVPPYTLLLGAIPNGFEEVPS